MTEKSPGMLGLEQFTTKQDLNGKILACEIRYVKFTSVQQSIDIFPLGLMDREIYSVLRANCLEPAFIFSQAKAEFLPFRKRYIHY